MNLLYEVKFGFFHDDDRRPCSTEEGGIFATRDDALAAVLATFSANGVTPRVNGDLRPGVTGIIATGNVGDAQVRALLVALN